MIILSYIVASNHFQALQRFASLKANMILSIVEFVFWVAAIVLSFMTVGINCHGAGCALAAIVLVIAVGLA